MSCHYILSERNFDILRPLPNQSQRSLRSVGMNSPTQITDLLAHSLPNTESMTVKNGGCTIECSVLGWLCELAHYISRDCAVAGGNHFQIISAIL